MKKLIPCVITALFFLGCAKEEPGHPGQTTEHSTAYILNYSGESPVWELVNLNDLLNNPESRNSLTKGNSTHAHGNYTGFGGTTSITFSGTENNGGTHGSAELVRTVGPFTAHVRMETSCVTATGNEAIYGGVVVEVVENNFPPPPPPPPPPPCPSFPDCPPPPPPPPCNPLDLGSTTYFKVFDNGQGNNAPSDQYQGLLSSCFGIADCASGFPWFVFGPPADVEGGNDKIKINN